MQLAWVDFETTGIVPRECAIIEAAITITDAQLRGITHHHFVIDPPSWCVARMDARGDGYVRGKVGYDEALWRELQAKPFSQVADRICELLKGRRLAGHCTHFEWGFLDVELQRCDLKIEGLLGDHRLLDLATLAYPLELRGEIENCSLWRICEALDVDFPKETRHRATSDIRATTECFRRLLQRGQVTNDIRAAIGRFRGLLQRGEVSYGAIEDGRGVGREEGTGAAEEA